MNNLFTKVCILVAGLIMTVVCIQYGYFIPFFSSVITVIFAALSIAFHSKK